MFVKKKSTKQMQFQGLFG